jgi:hypothetical protein
MISKSWSTSKKRALIYREAGPLAEFCLQLFPLLVVHSDDYGRFDGDPETVKLKCDPGSPRGYEDFEAALLQFEVVGLIQRFQFQGQPWLQIVKFDEHQPGLLSKRTTPKSPTPPTDTELSGISGLTKPNLTQENLTQGNFSESTPLCVVPPFLVFPAIGPDREFLLSEAQVAEWAELYSVIDVRVECRKALAWVKANPNRQKTAKGMPRFLNSWLTRAVDSGRGSRATTPAAGPVSAQGQANMDAMRRAADRIRGRTG